VELKESLMIAIASSQTHRWLLCTSLIFAVVAMLCPRPVHGQDYKNPFAEIPELHINWRYAHNVDSYMKFDWYPQFTIRQCVFQMNLALAPGVTKESGINGDNTDEMIFNGIFSFSEYRDRELGVSYLDGTFEERFVIFAGNCERRAEIAAELQTYLNDLQPLVEITAFVPDQSVLANYSDTELTNYFSYTENMIAAKKAAVEAECDPALWRKFGTITAKEGPEPRLSEAILSVYNAYAMGIEGQDIQPAISTKLPEDERDYVMKLVTYQMEHGPCGR